MLIRILLVPLLCLPMLLVLVGADAQPAPKKAGPRLDQYGDTLPEHAILRIGTSRLRPGGVVTSLAFTPDSKGLISLTEERGANLWEAASGKELSAFGKPATGLFGTVGCAVSADGSLMAVLEARDACRIYDTATGKAIRTLNASWSDLTVLCFSPDNQLLATTEKDQVIRIWQLNNGKEIAKRQFSDSLRDAPRFMSFAPDGKTLAITAQNRLIELWDFKTEQKSAIGVKKNDMDYREVAFSSDGKTLAAIDSKRRGVSLWDVASGQQIDRLPVEARNYGCLAMSPDGKSVATGDSAGTVSLWSLATGRLERLMIVRRGAVTSMAFSGDGKRLASGHADHTLRIWDLDSGKQIHDFAEAPVNTERTAFTSDGKAILSVSPSPGPERSLLRFWDPATGKLLRQLAGEPKTAIGSFITPDARYLAYSDNGRRIHVRDLSTGNDLRVVDAPAGWLVIGVELTPDGRWLAVTRAHVAGVAKVVRACIGLWDVVKGTLAYSTIAGENERLNCSFTPDARFLAVHSGAGDRGPDSSSLVLRDLRTGKLVDQTGPPRTPRDLFVFSPSGRLMAEEINYNAIGVRELATGKLVVSLRIMGERLGDSASSDDGRRLAHYAFSPDGRTVAASTVQGNIIVWNLFSESPFVKLSGHRGRVWPPNFSPDGKFLISAGDDATIVVWDLSRWTDHAAKPDAAMPAAVATELWQDMTGDDAAKAHLAIGRLLQSPKDALDHLRQNLQPFQAKHQKEVAKWIADLASERFADREHAMSSLQRLGIQAQVDLRKALASEPPLEVRRRVEQLLSRVVNQPLAGESLQALRALELLEMLGTSNAAELLDTLSRGEPGAWLTQEAAASLQRVRKRP